MGNTLALIAAGRYGHLAGTSGTATVPASATVVGVTCYSSAGGTLIITPGGANQIASAQPTITLPAGVPFAGPWLANVEVLGPGTTFAFSGTDTYVVFLSYVR